METNAYIIDLNTEALPRCFVLDEQDHVVMSCSAQTGQPVDPHFSPVGDALRLPLVLEQAVAILAERCRLERTKSLAARLGAYNIKVQLLRGSQATHTAVIVNRAAA